MEIVFSMVIAWFLSDYVARKLGCWYSIKNNKQYCYCWDCKNPKCNIFDKYKE